MNVKKQAYVVSLFMMTVIILSCELFQLQPVDRDNPMDPSSDSFLLADRSWEAPVFIENDDSGDADFPQVAFDSSGNALSVWQQSGNIMANVYTAGSG